MSRTVFTPEMKDDLNKAIVRRDRAKEAFEFLDAEVKRMERHRDEFYRQVIESYVRKEP